MNRQPTALLDEATVTAILARHFPTATSADINDAARDVLLLALHDTGHAAEGQRVLERAAQRHPANTDVLGALVAFSREAGDAAATRRWSAALEAARR